MKRSLLIIIAIFSMFLMLTGCLDFKDVETIQFANVPQSVYILGSDENLAAQDVSVTITSEKVNGTYELANNEYVATNGFDFSTTGSKTLTVRFGSATISFQYKVVHTAGDLFAEGSGDGSSAEQAILIEEPEHFQNIGYKVLGVVVPTQNDSEEEWKAYWQQVFPFLATGKYFKVVANIDFTGVTFKTLGQVGGVNYVPFTGTLEGNNKILSNITINEPSNTENTAIFAGINKAKISNLRVENARITSAGEKAAILWSGHGIGDADNISEVTNITVSGLVRGKRVSGLCGEGGNVIFRNCVNEADAYGNGPNSSGIAGLITNRHYAYKYDSSNKFKNEGNVLPTYNNININGIMYGAALYDCENKGTIISLNGEQLGLKGGVNIYFSGCDNTQASNPEGTYISLEKSKISSEWQEAEMDFIGITNTVIDNHRLVDFTERSDRSYEYSYYCGSHMYQSTTLTYVVNSQAELTYSIIAPKYVKDNTVETIIDYSGNPSYAGIKTFDNRWDIFNADGTVQKTNYSYLYGSSLTMYVLVLEKDASGAITNYMIGTYKFTPIIDPRLTA